MGEIFCIVLHAERSQGVLQKWSKSINTCESTSNSVNWDVKKGAKWKYFGENTTGFLSAWTQPKSNHVFAWCIVCPRWKRGLGHHDETWFVVPKNLGVSNPNIRPYKIIPLDSWKRSSFQSSPSHHQIQLMSMYSLWKLFQGNGQEASNFIYKLLPTWYLPCWD